MSDWLRDSRSGRGLRYRAVFGWGWLSLQLVALFLTVRVGHLLAPLSWPLRIAVLIPVGFALFAIVDIVSDKLDERVHPGYGAENAAEKERRSSSQT
jgi:hypothetical protein